MLEKARALRGFPGGQVGPKDPGSDRKQESTTVQPVWALQKRKRPERLPPVPLWEHVSQHLFRKTSFGQAKPGGAQQLHRIVTSNCTQDLAFQGGKG